MNSVIVAFRSSASLISAQHFAETLRMLIEQALVIGARVIGICGDGVNFAFDESEIFDAIEFAALSIQKFSATFSTDVLNWKVGIASGEIVPVREERSLVNFAVGVGSVYAEALAQKADDRKIVIQESLVKNLKNRIEVTESLNVHVYTHMLHAAVIQLSTETNLIKEDLYSTCETQSQTLELSIQFTQGSLLPNQAEIKLQNLAMQQLSPIAMLRVRALLACVRGSESEAFALVDLAIQSAKTPSQRSRSMLTLVIILCAYHQMNRALRIAFQVLAFDKNNSGRESTLGACRHIIESILSLQYSTQN